jgi:hypothetical protein
MNLETINKWLDEECGCSYTRLEELHNFYFEKYCDLQQENKKLKMIVNEYERLNKGFKITDVQKYNIDELLSYKKYKDNWDELKEYCKETKLKEFEKSYGKRYGKTFTQAEIIVCNMILDKMQELEKGSGSDVKD